MEKYRTNNPLIGESDGVSVYQDIFEKDLNPEKSRLNLYKKSLEGKTIKTVELGTDYGPCLAGVPSKVYLFLNDGSVFIASSTGFTFKGAVRNR